MKTFLRNHAKSLIVLGVIIGLFTVWTAASMRIVPIKNGSMDPTLPVGTVAFIKPDASLEPTDIITFQKEGEGVVTHTFIGYADDGTLMTKGDANLTPDVHTPALTQQDVLGKVVRALPPQRLLLLAALALVGWLLYKWKPASKKPDEGSKGELESQSNTDAQRVTSPA